MPNRDTGGPAYPRPVSEDRTQGDQCDGNRTIDPQDGMSLRDWFAGHALAGLLAAHAGEGISLPGDDKAAAWAYGFADAMIAHRKRPS